jgi:hypothetical protein
MDISGSAWRCDLEDVVAAALVKVPVCGRSPARNHYEGRELVVPDRGRGAAGNALTPATDAKPRSPESTEFWVARIQKREDSQPRPRASRRSEAVLYARTSSTEASQSYFLASNRHCLQFFMCPEGQAMDTRFELFKLLYATLGSFEDAAYDYALKSTGAFLVVIGWLVTSDKARDFLAGKRWIGGLGTLLLLRNKSADAKETLKLTRILIVPNDLRIARALRARSDLIPLQFNLRR